MTEWNVTFKSNEDFTDEQKDILSKEGLFVIKNVTPSVIFIRGSPQIILQVYEKYSWINAMDVSPYKGMIYNYEK